MDRRRGIWLAVAILATLTVFVLATRGPAPPVPNSPGTFSFAVLGDAPYYVWEDWQYRIVLQELDANDLAWVLHVGDIFWRPCTETLYRSRLDWFNGLRHPVIYTPGDNEWTDCWEPGSGAFAPLGRLERLREIFFDRPTRSLGGNPIELASQVGSDRFPEFVENARWVREGIVFATVHMTGSENGMEPFPNRTAEDDAAVRRRTEAAVSWLRATFDEARALDATAVVLAFHANPGFEQPADDPYRQSSEPFIETLEQEAEAFGGPVLMVHGDDHVYTVDHPLTRRTTGRVLENLTRMQVPGSPEVGWVRVTVTPGADEPFAFESRVIPRWKFW